MITQQQQPSSASRQVENFSLLVRIEKTSRLEGHFELAFIRIVHRSKQTNTSSIKQTTFRKKEQTVWVEDFIFHHVQKWDTFAFIISSDKFLRIGYKEFSISLLLPYLNTGELVTLTLFDETKQTRKAEVAVSFSLFERQDPLAGIFQPQLSLKPTNKQWSYPTKKKQQETKDIDYPVMCDCIDAFQNQPITELDVAITRKQIKGP